MIHISRKKRRNIFLSMYIFEQSPSPLILSSTAQNKKRNSANITVVAQLLNLHNITLRTHRNLYCSPQHTLHSHSIRLCLYSSWHDGVICYSQHIVSLKSTTCGYLAICFATGGGVRVRVETGRGNTGDKSGRWQRGVEKWWREGEKCIWGRNGRGG